MAQMSGQITVATAGTAVAGPDVGPGEFLIQPGRANSGAQVYVGNDGANDVSSSTGLSIAVGEKAIITVSSLSHVYFDAATSGDKIEWLFCARRAGGNPLVVDP